MSEPQQGDRVTEPAAELMKKHNGFPWCDTCKEPAVFNELFGNLHSTAEYQFGVPAHLDSSGHEVTMREWWATPTFGRSDGPRIDLGSTDV